MKKNKYFFLIFLVFSAFVVSAQNWEVTLTPKEYDHALRNPLKGFTTNSVKDHPWASLSHTYFKWNELENHETDGIEKIINASNQKWKGVAAKNTKVIPRVYLHWDNDKKYWPEDMQQDDYTSEQFQARMLRLIERLGACWDNDPRVAFVELGIFGKWGEHHSPAPTAAMQKLAADAFAKAFKNKKVSVRHMWTHFQDQPFGEYWDSWAHYDQMWGHGNRIKKMNDAGRYKEIYIGGEAAYGWGNSDIQPGASPTHSVALEKHRDFVINSIRWLHCTQLRWIDGYDRFNADAIRGAEEIQKVFGYRYVLDEVRFSFDDSLKIAFDVTNTGSAPFYYNWPVEVALLNSSTLEPVWKATMDNVDIRDWMPGEGWTDPEWKYVGSWQEYHPNLDWNPSKTSEWAIPPVSTTVEDKYKVDLPDGSYILSLSILDPAGAVPSIKFATGNYLNGGRHPLGLVLIGDNKCDTLPADLLFDEPNSDKTLFYDEEFEIVYERDPEQSTFGDKPWKFPVDTVLAWKFDYMKIQSGDKYFSLDSSNTIGIYGCNDTSGVNIREYKDSVMHKDAAQFNWDQTAETFQVNGQWLEYTADFMSDVPYQLLLRARNNVETNFKITISTTKGDTVFFRDFNLQNDFINLGGGNEQTDWFLSKIPMTNLWGTYIIRFDWYDNVGEPGVFGGFSFIKSELDADPPGWYYVSIGTFSPGTEIVVMTTEDATVYLVPDGTSPDTTSIKEAAVSFTDVLAYEKGNLSTVGLNVGDYVVFAIDGSNNISEPSRIIKLEYPVSANQQLFNREVSISYNQNHQKIEVKSTEELSQINIYNLVGKKVGNKKCNGKNIDFQTNGFIPGVYLVQVIEKGGMVTTKKVILT